MALVRRPHDQFLQMIVARRAQNNESPSAPKPRRRKSGPRPARGRTASLYGRCSGSHAMTGARVAREEVFRISRKAATGHPAKQLAALRLEAVASMGDLSVPPRQIASASATMASIGLLSPRWPLLALRESRRHPAYELPSGRGVADGSWTIQCVTSLS